MRLGMIQSAAHMEVENEIRDKEEAEAGEGEECRKVYLFLRE